jgi:hypothetical protein
MGKIMKTDIIRKLTNIKTAASQYDDVIGIEAADLRKEYAIIEAAELQKHIQSLADENRLLNIGIIGRVKAGKSSQLNSLFFGGKSILPKAATPMTASLTVMAHGDTFSATVEYYTQADIEKIKAEYDAYLAEYDQVYAQKKAEAEERAKKRQENPDMDKVKRQTDAVMQEKSSYSSYDHYERMKKSGGSAPTQVTERINANAAIELMDKLNDYVGSAGKKMPYTKSVELFLPELPENICVVDTPGINDPVPSRVIRTEEYLKKCDVVFIVSSAGQFLDRADTELMDRLSAKEGVRELYFIASKADDQLYGNVKEDSGQDLNKAVEMIREDLFQQAIGTLQTLKENNPEIAEQFDQLIKGGKDRVMVTSAMCHAMSLQYNKRESWDEEMNHVWGNLSHHYPDFFDGASAKTSLDKLSNVNTVAARIKDSQSKKKAIIAKKQEDYLAQQTANADQFISALTKSVSDKIERVTNTDVHQLKEEKKKVEKMFSKGSEAIDGTFEDCVDDFKAKLRNTVSEKSRTLFTEVKNETNDSQKTETRTKYWTTGWLIFKKEHSKNYDVTTVRAGAVKARLNDLLTDLYNELIASVESEKTAWKKSVQTRVTQDLMKAVEDVDQIDFGMLKTALRRLVNNMELPELDLSEFSFSARYEKAEPEKGQNSGLFSSFFPPGQRSYTGTLEDSEAKAFMDTVQTYLSDLKNYYSKQTNTFIANIEKSAKREKMSGMIFGDLHKQIETLEKELKNKQLILDRLSKCLEALKAAT